MTTHAPFLASTGLDNGNYPLVNVADPVNLQDAATKAFATNASNLASGTIASAILGNSSLFLGTTSIALNRASGSQALTGISSIDGSAGKLTTARSISITGDATWTTTFDGSAAATGALTLAATGVSAGTYNSVTVDVKGRVTSATNVAQQGITLGSTAISAGGTATTIGGLASVSSTNFVGALTGNASTASQVNVVDNTTLNASVYLLWANGTGTTVAPGTSSNKLSFNPSTGALTATKFIGDGSLLTGISGTGGGGASISTNLPLALALNASAGVDTRASASDHVHPLPTPAQINALGLPCPWNPLTNVATLPGGGTTNLAANSAPSGDNAFFASVGGTLLVPLTAAAGGSITVVAQGDIVCYVGTGWVRILASSNGTTGSVILKGDNAGGLANATPGVDFAPGVTLQTAVPIGAPGLGWVGVNGFLTIAAPNVFLATSSQYYYNNPGAWLYFNAGVIDKTQPAGYYFTVMGSTGVMTATLTAGGSGYVNGVYTNVPLTATTGTGSGAQANITVSGGAVTQVVIVHQGTGFTVGNTLTCAASNLGGSGSGLVLTVATLNAYNTSTGVASLTISNGGTGYVNGSYMNVPLTGGTGSGVQANITVQNGVVVAAQVCVQGSGYAANNSLTTAAANLGGAGSGLTLTTTIGGGPMTGVIYNHLYVPGNNFGAWSTSNLSLQVPATLTPFSGTQGGFYGAATNNGGSLVLTAVKVPGGYMGSNGKVNVVLSQTAQISSFIKTMQAGYSQALAGAVTNGGIGGGTLCSNGSHAITMATSYNRGVPTIQYAPAIETSTSGGYTQYFGTCNTAADFYVKSVVYQSSALPTGLNFYTTSIVPGSGYTNGVYTNVAMTGGSGTGMTANLTVANGSVTSVTITNAGTGYVVGNNIGASTSVIGPGTGFAIGLNGGVVAGGSGYNNGTYLNVPLTGGSGSGAIANITVVNGAVTTLQVTTPGTGYATGNVLSASTTYLGSAGSGFTYTLGNLFAIADWSVQEFLSVTVTPQP